MAHICTILGTFVHPVAYRNLCAMLWAKSGLKLCNFQLNFWWAKNGWNDFVPFLAQTWSFDWVQSTTLTLVMQGLYREFLSKLPQNALDCVLIQIGGGTVAAETIKVQESTASNELNIHDSSNFQEVGVLQSNECTSFCWLSHQMSQEWWQTSTRCVCNHSASSH